MNKKGMEEGFFYLYQVIFLAAVGIAIFSYIHVYADNTLTDQVFLAKDLSNTVTLLSTMPGNIYYEYKPTNPIDKFNYDFKNKIYVGKTTKVISDYFYPKKINLDLVSKIQPKQINFAKNGNTLSNQKVNFNLNYYVVDELPKITKIQTSTKKTDNPDLIIEEKKIPTNEVIIYISFNKENFELAKSLANKIITDIAPDKITIIPVNKTYKSKYFLLIHHNYDLQKPINEFLRDLQ